MSSLKESTEGNPNKLIIGLGNVGTKYENTRHNVGFVAVDSFGEKHKIVGKQEDDLLCWYGRGKFENFDVVLAWPTTFMNKSGEAVSKLLHWFKIKPNDLIVVHDDVALNIGTIRISYDSGAAGHHGVESIIQMLGGTTEFARLRIGIGPDPGGDKRADYVLRKFSLTEEAVVQKITKLSVEALEAIVIKGSYEAMNKFNGLEVK